jgi:Zn-dependent protease with chaperone function
MRTAAGIEPPTASQPESAPRTAFVSIEIAVHTAILFLILTPLYTFVLPVYYAERGIVDGYAAARLLLSLTGVHLPMVQQIRAEGWAFEQASIAVTIGLLLIAAVHFRRKAKRRLQAVSPGAVSGRDGRRYRAIPERLRSGLETELGGLWAMAKREGPPPRLYCFAAAPVIACALSDGGYPAIAVSAGLLERRMQGPDRLTRLILLHEIGHILVGDQIRLPRLEALAELLRSLMLG